MELDPTETFRQEAADLLDSLESSLLDLSQTPQDRDLIDNAFRSLHTIKGSGSMFGFDQVAAFTHDFETAFDLLRKGLIAPSADIISVSLAAKDHIRTLIDDPGATDPIIGDGILDDLRRYVGLPGKASSVQSPNDTPPPHAGVGCNTFDTEMRRDFLQESAEILDSMEAALLDLGQLPHDRTLIDKVFRALHTIKGTSGFCGYETVAVFTHDVETAFELLRNGQIEPRAEIISAFLSAKDHIRQLIESPATVMPSATGMILDRLRRWESQVQVCDIEVAHDIDTVSSKLGPLDTTCEGMSGWTIRMVFHPDILRNGTNPLALLDDVRALGPCRVAPDLRAVPTLDALDPASCLIAWDVSLSSNCSQADIEDVFMFVRDEMTLEMAPSTVPVDDVLALPAGFQGRPQAPAPDQLIAPPSSGSEKIPTPAAEKVEIKRRADDNTPTVRVQAERLDELMDRVGELVIAQARLTQLANGGTDLAIKSIAEEIERLASGLRDSTMGVRMVPMGSLFGRFRRLVHDLSRDLGKPVEFVTVGEDTELDKTMIERLADPLVHLIRNAIDHGVEGAQARADAGKDATGRIELSARYVGAQVLVTVSDDGAGLDVVRIRAKAEEQGLVTPGATLSEQEIYQFLFHPGFSTAKTISALSGRGVGMDVVKRTIEVMRGTIDLATRPGRGSTVTLRLPLTLAIIEGLLIRVGEGRYVIPLSAIEECIELNDDSDCRSRNRSFLSVRGDLVPFLRLREMFVADGTADPHQKVIITSTGEMRMGLVVDQIIGSHQTVVKSLSKLHSDVAMFSGATILGDGSAALILDVGQLIALGQGRPENATWAEAA